MEVDVVKLAEPKYVDGRAMRVAGVSGSYTRDQTGEIPKQWEQFNGELRRLEGDGQRYGFTLGVVYPMATMRYVTGVEIAPGTEAPGDWVEVTVPAQRYVVFAETGGVAMIRRVWVTIFTEWLPKAGVTVADGPMLERYLEDWLASGDFEIWVPVE